MASEALLQKVKDLPKVPGVYLFKNSSGKIIYIGKAKVLRNRVGSYFYSNLDKGTKTFALVNNIDDLSYIEALSELEAIILESALIKKHKPKYNIALKDDKSYLYIVIRNEVFEINGKSVKVPKVIVARETDLQKSDIKFGPYPHGDTAKYMLRRIRKTLPYRDCERSKFIRHLKLNTPCLYGQMGLCSAPCTSATTIPEYKKEVIRIKKLLNGESVAMLNSLEIEMKKAAKEQRYEEAAKQRDILNKFHYLRKSFKSAQKYIDNPYLVEDIITKSLDELVNKVPVITKYPRRIECYDISNISGKEAVGSMVVSIDGRITSSEYRKFKIKLSSTPDDFGMMSEVLNRRLLREVSSSDNVKHWGWPDLIVVDGGKGQVSAINAVLNLLNLNIPLIGLAKRYETIVYLQNGEFIELNLPKTNEGLKLLQRLRDESHRFAQLYHHQLRIKKIG